MLPETLSPRLCRWRPEGVSGRSESQKVLRQVRHLGVPAVDLLALQSSRDLRSLGVNNAAVGGMAADYFRELGFDFIAYCGFRGVYYCEARREAFVNYVEQLLRDTDLPLTKIAERAGFNYVECMMKLFKRKTGKTTCEYRAGRSPKR